VIKINTTVKTFQFDLQNRPQTYLQLSKKINDELMQRDLTLINTDVLLKMSIVNNSRVKELIDKNVMIGKNQSVWELGSDQDGFFNMDLGE